MQQTVFAKITLLLALVLGLGFGSSAMAKAPEWSYSYEKDGFSLTISSSPCYENNEMANMSMRLYGSKMGASISADASCDCGEAIIIDQGEPITPQSFARLVSEALSTQISSYSCKAVE